MDMAAVGARFRAARIKKRWRQQDLAERAHISRSVAARIELGRFESVTLASVLDIAKVLGIRIEWRLLSFDSDLDRLVNARHAALHESVARRLLSMGGWVLAPEVSYSVFGERGVIDILAWHQETRTLLVIELKTSIVDVSELMGKVDQKQRLAAEIARKRGWIPGRVAAWIIVADGSTNRRAVSSHRTTLRAAFPADGRTMGSWLSHPASTIRALSFWSNVRGEDAKPGFASVRRVRRLRPKAA
jgi:transcriptional regulator with XRE-family HTH domain